MLSPLVSIVVLNYNYAHFLPRSIESARGQDWKNIEVIIVDDCSTDHSREVIARFRDLTPVLQSENCGHGAAMNAGFAASKGDIVIFLDADDYLYPQAARRIVENQAPGVAQYQYRLDLVEASGQVIDAYPPREVGWDDGDVRDALLTCGRYATTVTSGLAFPRQALNAILPMDEAAFRMGGDGYLVTVAPFYGAVQTIDEVLGAYCQHGGSHSHFATAVAKRARWRVQHDEMRLQALHQHANRLGLSPRPQLWRNDHLHLQERVASLLLEPREHPDPSDRRESIARSAIAACRALPISERRRQVIQAWWLLVGFGPKLLAQRAVSWKLQAATRPAFVRSIARALRRATA